jgi:DnaJ-class molecular chaperone
MGDHSITNLKPGDLLVNVFVKEHSIFKRENTSLILDKELDVWDVILGTPIEILTLDKKTLTITVPPGTQPDTVLSCRGEGLPNMRTRQRGNLLIKIKVVVPRLLNNDQIALIKTIEQGNVK